MISTNSINSTTSCGCNCSGLADTTADMDFTCGCCESQVYTIIANNSIELPEEIIDTDTLPQWDLIKSVFYVILVLRYYIEKKARAPPGVHRQACIWIQKRGPKIQGPFFHTSANRRINQSILAALTCNIHQAPFLSIPPWIFRLFPIYC